MEFSKTITSTTTTITTTTPTTSSSSSLYYLLKTTAATTAVTSTTSTLYTLLTTPFSSTPARGSSSLAAIQSLSSARTSSVALTQTQSPSGSSLAVIQTPSPQKKSSLSYLFKVLDNKEANSENSSISDLELEESASVISVDANSGNEDGTSNGNVEIITICPDTSNVSYDPCTTKSTSPPPRIVYLKRKCETIIEQKHKRKEVETPESEISDEDDEEADNYYFLSIRAEYNRYTYKQKLTFKRLLLRLMEKIHDLV